MPNLVDHKVKHPSNQHIYLGWSQERQRLAIRDGREAVNFTIPLAAARLVANVTSYFPERLVEGVDIAGIFRSAQDAGKGTLIDIDDDKDHVTITLE